MNIYDVLSTAKLSSIKRHKMAAVAFSPTGTYIASSANQRGIGLASRFSVHAEEGLFYKIIKKLGMIEDRWGGIDVVVVRASRLNPWGIAKPCHVCQLLLDKLPIRRLWYTGTFPNIVRAK